MTTQPVDSTGYASTPKAKPTSQLNMETFMRLLTVQLSNQNPLEPMSDRDFFAQMAQLGQVQGIDKLTKTSDQTRAQDLFGKHVSGNHADPTGFGVIEVSGIVKGVTTQNGEQVLQVQTDAGGIVDMKVSEVNAVSSVDMPQGQELLGKTVTIAADPSNYVGIVRDILTRDGVTTLSVQTAEGKMVEAPLSSVLVARQTTDISALGALLGQQVTGPGRVPDPSTTDPNDSMVIAVAGTVQKIKVEGGVAKAEVLTPDHGTLTIAVAELTSVSKP